MSLFKTLQNIWGGEPEAPETPVKTVVVDKKIIFRSLLFVPANRPERFEKAANSGADAIIIDLEDSVHSAYKDVGREAICEYLQKPLSVETIVRINPLDSELAIRDIKAILDPQLPHHPDAIILPKAEGADSIKRLLSMMGDVRIPILPIATETAASVFTLGSYKHVRKHLLGITWGAEDLPAAIGAETSREETGCYTPPYEMLRSMTLFSAHAAQTQAIETVFPNIHDLDGLADYAARGARDGFTGMMALHPKQVSIINAAFSPNEEAVDHARAVIAAFASNPGSGVLELDGQMIDKPHLIQARKIVAAAAKSV